jgi:hypothetical protein
VAVDQRLTVFEDGAVQLEERHRSGDPIWLHVDTTEVERLRAALEAVPAQRRSKSVRRALGRLGRVFIPRSSVPNRSGAHFEVRWGRRTIAGESPDNPDLASVVDQLDALRVRAVRADPR